MIKLDELNVAAAGGDGAIMDEYEDIRHSWVVPRELVDPVTQSPAERIKIITVIGDSMYPEYTAGMKVMVDTNHRVPSPPGVYVIWDGFAQYIKRLDLYRDEEGTNKVQIISANPDYPTRTMNLDDLHVNGRVIGKWTWT
jgi:phage repressor protein C with HTH and peptisase S24 domain